MRKKQKFYIYKKKTKITDGMQHYVKSYQYISDDCKFDFDIYAYDNAYGYNDYDEMFVDIKNKEALHSVYTYNIRVIDDEISYSTVGSYMNPQAKKEIEEMIQKIPQKYFLRYFLLYNGV